MIAHAADAFLGIKAIKVSKNPTASKGYITIAKVFLVLLCVITVYHIIMTIVGGRAAAVVSGINLANSALNIFIYNWFIKSAEDVRKDVLNETK